MFKLYLAYKAVQGVKGWVPCVCNPNPQVKVCDSCSLCVKRREQAAQK